MTSSSLTRETPGCRRIADSGSLPFGGYPLLCRHLAVAGQESHLFFGTTRQSLLLAAPGASRLRIETSCGETCQNN